MKSSGKRVFWLTAIVFGAAVAQQAFIGSGAARTSHTPLPLPELMVRGWVNTDAPPTRESLAGRWVIVSLSSLRCPSCRVEAPLLARVHRGIADRDDVALVGFDPDPADTPAAVQEYVDSVRGFDWPVGVGAELMSEFLQAPQTPTLVLFAPDGQSVWRGHFAENLVRQLKDRLGIDSVQIER